MKTFKQFLASVTRVDCLSTHFTDAYFEPNTPGLVYDGGMFMEELADGEFKVIWLRDEHYGARLEMEAILFAYYLGETDASEYPNPKIGAFVSAVLDMGYPVKFAAALLANNDGGNICHHQDYCDANQFALDATGMPDDDQNIDAMLSGAADIYNDAAPYIRSDAQC